MIRFTGTVSRCVDRGSCYVVQTSVPVSGALFPLARNPPAEKPMKQQLVVFLGGAIALIFCSTWMPSEQAAARSSIAPMATAERRIEFPLGQRCAVTLDTRAESKPVVAGTANIVTGFDAPDVTVGILVRMDNEWLVLRDGTYENWIPMNKVLMVHAYD
jgi:hypothetical protein